MLSIRAAIAKAKRAAAAGAKGANRRRKASDPVSPRYRGKRDGDLNNDGRLDRGDDLDPKSQSYRFRDTGYVAGSRKELAAQAIRIAAKKGTRLRSTDIDWAEIEQNPREAKALITKSNLFGKVDWAGLRESGMTPEAGFLIDRVYASVAKEPDDSPEARKAYAMGLESLRNRLERAKTADDVTTALAEIRDERRGVMLNAKEADEVRALREQYSALTAEAAKISAEGDALYRVSSKAEGDFYAAKNEIDKRQRRGWKVRPEDTRALSDAEAARDIAQKAWRDHLDATKAQRQGLDAKRRDIGSMMRAVQADAATRAQNNPANRAWDALGARFHGVLDYRGRGSKAFAEHVASAKGGKVKDWSWAEAEATTAPKSTKASVTFQLMVADGHERVGGRAVAVDSTQALKDRFALREVQSGNWVLADVNSAKFHTERAAESFADLADVIKVPDAEVSMNGRLALAFGARGSGAKGFAGGAPVAHYEPVQRVINLTKMGGGGSLAHEWLHALDNMAMEMELGRPGKAGEFMIESPDKLPLGDVREAVTALRDAMWRGDNRATISIPYTAADVQTAKANMDNPRGAYGLAKRVKDAGDIDKAIIAVRETYAPSIARSKRGAKKARDRWITIAAAYYDANPAGGIADAKAGDPVSSFALEARKLDSTRKSAYWATTKEMAARAFQAYVEDKLSAQGRKNTYLSDKADNRHYAATPWKPFPEGEERERINAAFDNFFATLRRRETLKKAFARFATPTRPRLIANPADRPSLNDQTKRTQGPGQTPGKPAS